MADLALDYYMKGLSIQVRQHLLHHMRSELSPTMLKYFRERDEGYPSFRSCGFSDDNIQTICESYVPKFAHANQVMEENGRPPLFSDPHDVYRSATEHAELMRPRSPEELRTLFGCSFEDYMPPCDSISDMLSHS